MTLENMLTKTIEKLEDRTKLRAFSPGSIARGLLTVYNEVADEIYTLLNTEILNSYISTATGEKLSEIGKLLGVNRKSSTYAVGTIRISIDPIYQKTLDDLKDIIEEKTGNRPENIVIPKGTEVISETGFYVYTTIDDVILSDNTVEVDVISLHIGSSNNVGSNTLVKIGDSSIEVLLISDFLIVTNPLPIDTGEDEESDENFRFRIVNAYTALATSNLTALRLAALSVPGVADVVIRPYAYGIGTVGMFVISESPIVSKGILNAVQEAVNSVTSAGERVVVSAPNYKGLKLSIVLEFKHNTPAGDKDNITRQVQTNCINYVNNLKLGEEFVVNELKQIIMQTSDYIYDHQLNEMGIGEYNFRTGLIDYFEATMIVNQPIDLDSKFVTNEKLMYVCY